MFSSPSSPSSTNSKKTDYKQSVSLPDASKSFRLPIQSYDGTKKTTVLLNKNVWSVPFHQMLVSRALVTELANSRQSSKKTKNRGEVSGGGKKPWKQKGTGRARAGSNRSPLWRGGGVTFGPTGKENYTKKMNKKEKTSAFLGCLAELYRQKKIVIVDLPPLNKPKTKSWLEVCKKFAFPAAKGLSLVVLHVKQQNWKLSFQNLPHYQATSVSQLRFADLVRAEKLILDETSLQELEKRFSIAHD